MFPRATSNSHTLDVNLTTIYTGILATATVTYHRICNKMGATSGAGTAYRSRAPAFSPNFKWGSCYLTISFLCSVLSFFFQPLYCYSTVSPSSIYDFSIFKLFFFFFLTNERVDCCSISQSKQCLTSAVHCTLYLVVV